MKTITFIIPVYNEEKRLAKTFEALSMLKLPKTLKLEEVIFVDDGSTDHTKLKIKNARLKIQKALKAPITLIPLTRNQGKGAAVKAGMLASKSDYSLFFDADISTPLSEIEKFMPFIKNNIDVIVGTRKNGKSTVLQHQPLVREKLGQGFTKLTQVVLQMQITDFTCGFKAFSRNAATTIFPKTVVSGWGYDAEILFIAKQNGLILQEKAVTWSNDPKTTVKLYKAIPQTMLDLARIRATHSGRGVFELNIYLPHFGIIYRGVTKLRSAFL